jgi:hypothetical protein
MSAILLLFPDFTPKKSLNRFVKKLIFLLLLPFCSLGQTSITDSVSYVIYQESGVKRTYLKSDINTSLENGRLSLLNKQQLIRSFTNINQVTSPVSSSLSDLQSKIVGILNSGSGSVTYATNQEVVGQSHVAHWGDSMTEGLGGYDATYPHVFGTLSGMTVYNGGVGGNTSTQIKTRFLANPDKYNYSTIFWGGINDQLQAIDTTVTKQNFDDMVTALGHNRFIILGVTKINADTPGTGTATRKDKLNAYWAGKYPNNFLDVQAYLLTQGNGGSDNTAVGNGLLPPSLMSDAIHLNKAGYAKVAQYALTKLSVLVPGGSKAIGLSNAPALNNYGQSQISVASGGKFMFGGLQGLYVPVQTGTNNSMFVGNGGLLATSTAQNNFGGGINSLLALTDGDFNVGVGPATLSKVTTQQSNTAIGAAALFNNIANSNSAFGANALTANTTGTENLAAAYNAALANQTGSRNVDLGPATRYTATAGNDNLTAGWHAALNSNGGNYVLALGASAGTNLTSASNVLIIGNNINAVSATASGQLNIGNILFGSGVTGTGSTIAGRLGIGTNAPAATSILDVTSTTAGFLTPRMSTTQRDAIASPAEGLEIYNLTDHTKQFYNGTVWKTITTN